MKEFDFSLDFEVRDYECDLQGIVNNSVYFNYLEHCRHSYLKFMGFDFAELTKEGINLVVAEANMKFRAPLVSGDKFTVYLKKSVENRLKLKFEQHIYREDNKCMLKASFFITSVVNNKLKVPEKLTLFFQ